MTALAWTPAHIRQVLGPREPLLDAILRESLLGGDLPPMQIDDNAARLLQLLTLAHRPRRAVELGCFFGWSAIHIARGLPPGGHLITVEVDPVHAALARRNLERAGVEDRVTVVVGDAADYLASLAPGTVDLLFIDADKERYPLYLKLGFPVLAEGGLLIADDAFADGDYRGEAGDGDDEAQVRAINSYNRAVARSPRLLSAFVGTDNGMLVSYRLASDARAEGAR